MACRGLLGIQGSNPGFLDQNQACFLYTNPQGGGFELHTDNSSSVVKPS